MKIKEILQKGKELSKEYEAKVTEQDLFERKAKEAQEGGEHILWAWKKVVGNKKIRIELKDVLTYLQEKWGVNERDMKLHLRFPYKYPNGQRSLGAALWDITDSINPHFTVRITALDKRVEFECPLDINAIQLDGRKLYESLSIEEEKVLGRPCYKLKMHNPQNLVMNFAMADFFEEPRTSRMDQNERFVLKENMKVLLAIAKAHEKNEELEKVNE